MARPYLGYHALSNQTVKCGGIVALVLIPGIGYWRCRPRLFIRNRLVRRGREGGKVAPGKPLSQVTDPGLMLDVTIYDISFQIKRLMIKIKQISIQAMLFNHAVVVDDLSTLTKMLENEKK